MRPNSATACRAMASQLAMSAASKAMPVTRPLVAPMASTVSAVSRISAATTAAPSRASASQ